MIRKILLSTAAVVALSSASFAADLPARGAVRAPAFAPVFTWTGFYVGAQFGGAWTTNSALETPLVGGFNGTGKLDTSGAVGGLHAGYNYQMGAIVLGLEADIEAAGLRKNSVSFNRGGALLAPGTTYNYGTKLDWQGSVRGRLGYAVGPTLFYVTGGAAFANFNTFYNNAVGGIFAATNNSFSDTRVGWTVGGGIEYAFNNTWSARVEYRYSDYGKFTNVIPAGAGVFSGFNERQRLQENAVRVGISYKFGAPASAVVARY